MQCLQCNKETTNPKFCSRSCSVTYHNIILKKKPLIVKCKYCGKEINSDGRLRMQFCNRECLANHRKTQTYQRFLDGEIIHQTTLRNVIRRNFKQQCSICGITEWCNKPLVFIIDHIDGNPENNNPDNLRLLCSNCDSQLPTYKSKNKGHGRHKRRERYANGQSY